MIKVHTFNDLSEANLAATWGTRYAKGLRDGVFKHSNPYCLLEVSDHFGKYASVPNPPAAESSISRSRSRKPIGPNRRMRRRRFGTCKSEGGTRRSSLLHPLPRVAGERGRLPAIQALHEPSRQELHLAGEGRPDVRCHLSISDVAGGAEKLRELEVVIPPAEYAKMAKGVAYTLHPVKRGGGLRVEGARWADNHTWQVR